MIADYCMEHGLDLDDVIDLDEYNDLNVAWEEFVDFASANDN